MGACNQICQDSADFEQKLSKKTILVKKRWGKVRMICIDAKVSVDVRYRIKWERSSESSRAARGRRIYKFQSFYSARSEFRCFKILVQRAAEKMSTHGQNSCKFLSFYSALSEIRCFKVSVQRFSAENAGMIGYPSRCYTANLQRFWAERNIRFACKPGQFTKFQWRSEHRFQSTNSF
jgi:hypothetical protein